jgi:ATP-binding protein involved in chromosome partitioning
MTSIQSDPTSTFIEHLTATLNGLRDPNTLKTYGAQKAIGEITYVTTQNGTTSDVLNVTVKLGYPCISHHSVIAAQLQAACPEHPLNVTFTTQIQTHRVQTSAQAGLKPLPNVKNVIAIASGKGGVGKSTTAVNVALALAKEGARVGILDADIYGPSQPTMLGVSGKPEMIDDKTMRPITAHGLQVNSIGFMLDDNAPAMWRGPMVSSALQQLFNQTGWDALDYLIVDMPPGTGDIQLTLAQKIPVTAAVIVTTPQDIALIDARKGLRMFEKVGIPVLGVIENMAHHICSQCGHSEPIFGAEGGQRMASDYQVDYLGGLPLDIRIRQQTDSGTPTVIAEPNGDLTHIYQAIAIKIAAAVALKPKDYASKMPSVTVESL